MESRRKGQLAGIVAALGGMRLFVLVGALMGAQVLVGLTLLFLLP